MTTCSCAAPTGGFTPSGTTTTRVASRARRAEAYSFSKTSRSARPEGRFTLTLTGAGCRRNASTSGRVQPKTSRMEGMNSQGARRMGDLQGLVCV